MNGETRDPWAVLLSYLGELKSDEVVRIVSRAGLSVDWTLSEKESYSHGTRIRAYLPRIGTVFSNLRQEEKGSVLRKVLAELARIHPRSEELQREFETQPASDEAPPIKVAVPISIDPKKVFVVHGRDKSLRDGLFALLRALGLEPIDWAEAIRLTRKGSPFIGEVLDTAFNQAQAIVVLLSPDDEVRLSLDLRGLAELETEKEFRLQPRPNVLFEAGMGFGRNPDRTILVEVGDVKAFSDIAGRHMVRLSNDEVRRRDLADRLTTAGCAVKLEGDDWKNAGDFVVRRPSAKGREIIESREPQREAAVKWVGLTYPRDSGLQAELEGDGYIVRWSADSTLARRLDIEGWSLVTKSEQDRDVVFKVRDEPENQTLLKKKNTTAE